MYPEVAFDEPFSIFFDWLERRSIWMISLLKIFCSNKLRSDYASIAPFSRPIRHEFDRGFIISAPFYFVLFTRSNQLKGKFAVRSGSYEKIFGVPK